MRFIAGLVICLLCTWSAQAQYALWGNVTNSYGEKLEGASVFIMGSDQYGAITDYTGYYTLDNIPAGTYELKVTFLGYESLMQTVELTQDMALDLEMKGSAFQLDNIEIIANKLNAQSPYSFVEQDAEDLGVKNAGQDLPFLVEHTPSMVVTSDAGAGIGYTGMRIRGSDATRINVTINGVPLNDSESHGVFWVNLPDLASSVDKIQIQRGVGPSTNGTGAFGGTVGLSTNHIPQNPAIKIESSLGSFNTSKVSASFTSGLMNQKYLLEGKYAVIDSDGFIDRATSDLSSYFFSGAKVTPSSTLRLNVFGGKEVTYQAWNGVPEAKINGTQEELLEHFFNNSNGDYNTVADSLNLFNSGRSYNAFTYDNQVDDYTQTHVQLIFNKQLSETLLFNATGHFTHGEGFFEQFEFQEDLTDWPSLDRTDVSDLVVQRWLDNDFFGVILNGEAKPSEAFKLNLGLSYNLYDGDHFGEVVNVFSEPLLTSPSEYYRSEATKTDLSAYIKAEYDITDRISIFGDAQVRNLTYQTAGTDNDLSTFDIDTSYNFFNPKAGFRYLLDDQSHIYGSVAIAQREPVRSDFLDAQGVDVPRHEHLTDFELGYRMQKDKLSLETNLYYMKYIDQLVVTGAVNDVGGSIRTNVDDSYRAGIELSLGYAFSEYLKWTPNLAFSQNKIRELTDEVTETVFSNTDISLSPNIIGGSRLTYSPLHNLELDLLSKYVSKQFIDNTSNDDRSLPAYFVNDLVATYTINLDLVEEIQFKLLINNFLNTSYSSNAYTYSYIYGGLITENYLYPQAGINFLLSASVTF
jgi:iron complex outermembrane receptor protein